MSRAQVMFHSPGAMLAGIWPPLGAGSVTWPMRSIACDCAAI